MIRKIGFFFFVFLYANLGFAQEALKEWTWLFYVNGNNNMAPKSLESVNELEAIGSTPEINVVVQWAKGNTKRLYITRDNEETTKDPTYACDHPATPADCQIRSPVLQELGRVDMGDPKTLEDFIQWGVQAYPAKKYLISIWNHGGGILGISQDEFTGHVIRLPQLGQVMERASQWMGHPVDVLSSEACEMSIIELGSELRGAVQFAVGFPVTDYPSWEYDGLLEQWSKTPGISPGELSRLFVEWIPFRSSLDVSMTPGIEDALREFKDDIVKSSPEDRVRIYQALHDVAAGSTPVGTIDLFGIVYNLKEAHISSLRPEVLDRLASALDSAVYASGNPSGANKDGLRIWLPMMKMLVSEKDFGKYEALYGKLKFQQRTGWLDAARIVYSEGAF